MSASACVAYIGLRYEVSPNEIESLELRADPRQRQAKLVGLNSYWGNFGGQSERHLLFVGTEIAILGPEGRAWTTTTAARLAAIVSETEQALSEASLDGECALHLEWLEDN